jgi:hypothetical protein
MLTGCYRKIQIPMNSGSTRASRSEADFKITLQGWTLDAAAIDNTRSFDTTLPTFDNTFTATPEP